MQDLVELYAGRHFKPMWNADELDWAAIALKRI
jgi:hypothetical protein